MSISDKILSIWKSSSYQPPQVPLIYFEYQYMVTIEDDTALIRFMTADGQIYAALKNRCPLGTLDPKMGSSVYLCNKINPIQCCPTGGPSGNRDLFVLNNIAPLIA